MKTLLELKYLFIESRLKLSKYNLDYQIIGVHVLREN